MNTQPPGSTDIDPPQWRTPAITAGIVAFIIAVIAIIALVARSGGEDLSIEEATTTTEIATTTIAEATTTEMVTTTMAPTTTVETTTTTTTIEEPTTTTTALDPAQFEVAIWPWFGSGTRYDTPTAAARGFAIDYIGFQDPIIGDYLGGDSRSGEVEVRAFASGDPTVVSVRRLADDTWWVLGAQTPNIIVTTPRPGAMLTSRLQITGRSLTYDGTVDFAIRRDGSLNPVFGGFVTGGAVPGALAPFDGSFDWSPPSSGRGSIVFTSLSPEDGRIISATAQRIRFS